MDEQNISLLLPKEIQFTKESLIKYLVIENNTMQKLVFKIRTNHKSSLSINVTHDFINPNTKRQIPVKLLQVHEGVKLQINYAKPTEQMILKNDAKMNTIEKKYIKKQIVYINAKDLQEKSEKQEDSMNSSFRSVKTQQNTQTVEVKVQSKPVVPPPQSPNFSKGKSAVVEVLHTVEQHPEEDDDELEERKKKMEEQIKVLEEQIATTKEIINEIKSKTNEQTKEKSVMPPQMLIGFIVVAFLLGWFLKKLIIG